MVPQTTTTGKPVFHYGWLYDEHGIFCQLDEHLSFRTDATETWQDLDYTTLQTYGVMNGRVDLADHQQVLDGHRVHKTSRTLQPARPVASA